MTDKLFDVKKYINDSLIDGEKKTFRIITEAQIYAIWGLLTYSALTRIEDKERRIQTVYCVITNNERLPELGKTNNILECIRGIDREVTLIRKKNKADENFTRFLIFALIVATTVLTITVCKLLNLLGYF